MTTKERPILFSDPMVRAILDGRKTQTRRLIKTKAPLRERPTFGCKAGNGFGWFAQDGSLIRCPYGLSGDRLWVREAFWPIYPQDPKYQSGEPIDYDYRATYQEGDRLAAAIGRSWRPSIHMPRDASRLLLEIESICIERLHQITELNALHEGVIPEGGQTHTQAFQFLWEMIHGADNWSRNPWVWCVVFKRIQP